MRYTRYNTFVIVKPGFSEGGSHIGSGITKISSDILGNKIDKPI